MNEREQQIEAILFYENGPMNITTLAQKLGISVGETQSILAGMGKYYEGRGIVLVLGEREASLRVSPKVIPFIEESEEEGTPLSKQALETLAIILYRGEVGKSDIDFIRGVNASFILRNLRMRGLVDRRRKGGEYVYFPTSELYAKLGLRDRRELPAFSELTHALSELEVKLRERQEHEGKGSGGKK